MPSSNLAVAPTVLNFLWEKRPVDRPLRVLDVGPGWGKYATLIREYVDPNAHITGLEAWAPYVVDHQLAAKYDVIWTGDARTASPSFFDQFDAVLIIDVIEHMTKTEGFDLIARIAGWVIVSTPRDFFSNGPGHPPTEEHISHWSLEDFTALDRFDVYDLPALRDLGGIIVRLKPTA